MVDLNWQFHPLEGIVLAGVLFALYYWIIRMRCQARKAQTYIFAVVLAVSVCSFTSLTLVKEYDNNKATNSGYSQSPQPYTASDPAASDSPYKENVALMEPSDKPWDDILQVRSTKFLTGVYAAGVLVVAASFVAQLLWLLRLRRRSLFEMEEDGVGVYTTQNGVPFSVFNSVFLPSSLDDKIRRYALIHEKSHIRHHHFLKLCMLLLLVALNWFNPFVWMFFNEMKMQQELEVDTDVLDEGIDRRSYQMSLLEVCVQNSRWLMVQSAFGAKSLKQRIIFMNRKINGLASNLRLAACMLVMGGAFAASIAVRANISYIVSHHPLEGCWTMDFTRPANTTEELYPPFKQYAFYNHDTFFSPHFRKRDGLNFFFGFSGEEVVMRDGTLVNAHGDALVYRFVTDDIFQCDWNKSTTDNSLAQGEVITDQWSRATPPADVTRAFSLACEAGNANKKPLDGVWQQEPSDGNMKSQTFVLVNDNLLMAIEYAPDPDESIYRYSGGGFSCVITTDGKRAEAKYMNATIVMQDNDHAVMHVEGHDKDTRLRRVTMPPYIHRMLATTKVGGQ